LLTSVINADLSPLPCQKSVPIMAARTSISTILRSLDIAISSTLLVKVLAVSNIGLYIPEQCVNLFKVRGGADKSLARPGRKQATANKLWIYSAYYLRSKIYFLARCSNLCKPPPKIRSLSVLRGLRCSNDLRVGRKMATFQLFFQSREQVMVRRG